MFEVHNDEQYDNTTLTVGLASLTNISFIASEKSALKIPDLRFQGMKPKGLTWSYSDKKGRIAARFGQYPLRKQKLLIVDNYMKCIKSQKLHPLLFLRHYY